MRLFDRWFQDRTRSVARRTSRRSFLRKAGVLLVGAGAVPPAARSQGEYRTG